MKYKGGVKPVSSLSSTQLSGVTCKHFFPCSSLTGGNLVDVIGGVVAQPQAGYEFEVDAARGAIRSTCNDITQHTMPLVSGAWSPVLADQYVLVVTAGYMDESLTVTSYPPDYFRWLRLALGDVNGNIDPDNAVGFGLSDGYTARVDPAQAAGAIGHAVLRYDSAGTVFLASSKDAATSSLGDTIYAAISTGGFFRYALARPSTYEMEGAAHNSDTFASILSNDLQYGLVSAENPAIDVQFAPAFRMSGFWATGIAVFVTDSLQANYLDLIKLQCAEWQRGNKVILPYWD